MTHMAAPKPGTDKSAQVLTECFKEISICIVITIYEKFGFWLVLFYGENNNAYNILVCFLQTLRSARLNQNHKSLFAHNFTFSLLFSSNSYINTNSNLLKL